MSDETLPDSGSASQDLDTSPAVESSSPAPETSQSQAPAQQDVWSNFRSMQEFKGQADPDIARNLYGYMQRERAATKALSQYQQLIPYAQEYAQYKPQFDQWRAQQSQQMQPAPQPQQMQQQAAPPKQGWWNPPPVRESYKQYLVKDENGREVIHPDAPLDARHSLYEYQKYKADFAQKFLSDPQEALGPMVEDRARSIAQQIVQEQFQQAQEASYVSGLEKENSDWLYQADGRTPTREGLMVQRYIGIAAQRGIVDPEARWEYACDLVERDLQAELLQEQAAAARAPQFTLPPPQQQSLPAPQAPVAQNQAQRDIEYLRREASRNPSRATANSDPRSPKGPMTFEQRLRAQMSRDGLN